MVSSTKCPKNGTWRNVDISSLLQEIISELKNDRLNEKYVLLKHPEWKHGDAGKVLRMFLERIGIKKDVVFHTLRVWGNSQILIISIRWQDEKLC
jgi:hypothetical protein